MWRKHRHCEIFAALDRHSPIFHCSPGMLDSIQPLWYWPSLECKTLPDIWIIASKHRAERRRLVGHLRWMVDSRLCEDLKRQEKPAKEPTLRTVVYFHPKFFSFGRSVAHWDVNDAIFEGQATRADSKDLFWKSAKSLPLFTLLRTVTDCMPFVLQLPKTSDNFQAKKNDIETRSTKRLYQSDMSPIDRKFKHFLSTETGQFREWLDQNRSTLRPAMRCDLPWRHLPLTRMSLGRVEFDCQRESDAGTQRAHSISFNDTTETLLFWLSRKCTMNTMANGRNAVCRWPELSWLDLGRWSFR